MKSRRILAVTLTLTMLLAAVVPASAAAGRIFEEYWIDQSGGGWNPCTNEWVEIRGRSHIVDLVVFNASGGGTLKHHVNTIASGLGMETGTQYVLRQVSNELSTSAFDYTPYVYTSTSRYQIVAPGPGNNDVYWESWHVTVNANGTVTSEVDNSGWECK